MKTHTLACWMLVVVACPPGVAQQGLMQTCSGPRLVQADGGQPAWQVAAGSPFDVLPIFDGSETPAERAVIQAAIDDWEITILASGVTTSGLIANPFPIGIGFGLTDPGVLGSTSVNTNGTMILSASITFDAFALWYVDPTPDDDDELLLGGPGIPGYDLLTVARHELGHTLGWNGWVSSLSYLQNGVFDPSGLNIQTLYEVPCGASCLNAHADPAVHSDALMQPTLNFGERLNISSYPDAALLALAVDFDLGLKFVDPQPNGTGSGFAKDPWTSLSIALGQATAGTELMLLPGNYGTPAPLVLSSQVTLRAPFAKTVTLDPGP